MSYIYFFVDVVWVIQSAMAWLIDCRSMDSIHGILPEDRLGNEIISLLLFEKFPMSVSTMSLLISALYRDPGLTRDYERSPFS